MPHHPLPSLLDDLDTPPPTTEQQAALCILLRPRIEQLADDVWALAQKSPALAADPALVALAAAQLADLRRILRGEPGVHLLPPPFAPGISLHALALGLRAMQRALAVFLARRRPFAGGEAPPPDISTLNAMLLELTRDAIERIARNRGVTLSPALQRPGPEDDDDADDDAPEPTPPRPAPAAYRNAARRRNRLSQPAENLSQYQSLAKTNPRILHPF
jgi:hypothetical protein